MIVVTGATGTVGRELVKLLTEQKIPFKAICHSLKSAQTLSIPSESVSVADLKSKAEIRSALSGATNLFLLTPITDQNLTMQHGILDVAYELKVKHVVKVGTIVTEKDKRIAHAQWHQEIEHKITKSNLSWTFLRPTLFSSIIFEPWTRSSDQSRLRLPLRNGRIPFVDPKDVALVGLKALLEPNKFNGKVFSLTGPEALSMEQIAIILSKYLNQDIRYQESSNEDFLKDSKNFKVPSWLAQDLAEIFNYFASNHGSNVTPLPVKILGRPTHFRDYLERIGPEFIKRAATLSAS